MQFVNQQFSKAYDVVYTKLKSRSNSYSSFRITMNGIPFKDLLNPENWPSDVLIKCLYKPVPSKHQTDTTILGIIQLMLIVLKNSSNL